MPKFFASAIIVTVGYFAAGWLGLAFAMSPGNVTVVWPASGIAVASLLLLGYRIWPAVWVGACLVNLTTEAPVGLAPIIATGNVFEAVFAVWLLRRFLPNTPLASARDALIFSAAAASSSIVAATVGTALLLVIGSTDAAHFSQYWSTWWLGDVAGEIVVVPLILAIAQRRWLSTGFAHYVELVALFALQVALSFLLFGGFLPDRITSQILYWPMILLIWCSVRFGLLEVAASNVLFFTAAIWGTWSEIEIAGCGAVYDTLFDVLSLLLAYAITSLVLSSIVYGQRTAMSASQRSQAELREQTAERNRAEAWFRQVLAASPDALIVSDTNGHIVLINDAAERLFGYSRSEIVGQPIETLLPARFREKHHEYRQRYLKSPFVRLMGSGIELTACTKDGSEFAAEITLGPANADGDMVVFSAVRDVSSRKLAEQALRDSEERFTLAVQGTDAGIWDWDLRTNDVYFSPRWKSMLGYEDDEISSEFAEWEDRLHPEDRSRALVTIREYLDGRSPEYVLEHRVRHRDGSFRWILARGVMVTDAAGKPYRMAGSHLDITNRKRMEETLRRQLDQFIEAEQIQTHLLPKQSPTIPGFDIAGQCYPAEFAAGDYFDYLWLKNGLFVGLIGDVSGHGVGPAILMASLHSHVRSLADVHDNLAELITQSNNILGKEVFEENFVTLLGVVIDPNERTLTYVRCGHPPGFIMNRNGEITARMEDGGLPLGVLQGSKYRCSNAIQLESGDTVVLLTDGVLESSSPNGEPFDFERTEEVVRQHRDKPSAQIIERLRLSVADHTKRSELEDDLTIVVIKVK